MRPIDMGSQSPFQDPLEIIPEILEREDISKWTEERPRQGKEKGKRAQASQNDFAYDGSKCHWTELLQCPK
jgi:hypothetical protein